MPKKIFGVAVFLVGALIFAGAGCVKNNIAGPIKEKNIVPDNNEQISTNLANAGSEDICNSAKEIDPPNDLAKELKEIFTEAGGEVIIIGSIAKDSLTGDVFVFVWKKKPTMKKLEDTFKKHGYEIEISGDVLIITKGKITLSVSLADKGECDEVTIMVSDKPFKPGGTVTKEECEKMLEITKLADVRSGRPDIFFPAAIKLFHYWSMLAAKYGMTKELVADICEKMLGYK